MTTNDSGGDASAAAPGHPLQGRSDPRERSLVDRTARPGVTSIALDVMGGDHAPAAPLSAAAHFSLKPDCPDLVLVGDEAVIRAGLAAQEHDPKRLRIVHAPFSMPMDGDPKTVLDAHPDASILVAARLVHAGEAHALVSAGNTGGVVLACARSWSRLPGVPRAALGAVYPTERTHGDSNDPFALILDAGLTLDVDAETLVAFAVMGSAYASRISRNARPSVALLSNGSEPKKGTDAVVAAHALLAKRADLNFVGNVEGTDIARGVVDVIVTGGFTGNIVIKMLEGVAETMQSLMRTASDASLVNKAGLALLLPALKELKKTTDWQQYGGAPILGFDRVCIKAHGRSSPRAIKNAIKVARRAVDTDLVSAIRTGLAPSA